MPDEGTPAPEETQDTPTPPETEDTPSPEPADEGTDAPESVDYQKRYEDLQPEYTRATQEAAQYRQIVELAQQGDPEALELLGLQVEKQDTEDDDQDPDQPLTRAEFEQFQQAQSEERQKAESEQAFNDDLWSAVEAIEKKEGREITDEEAGILRDVAVAQVVRGGTFDLDPTWEAIRAQDKAAVERYVNSKKQAPAVPIGSAGDEKIDLSDDDARQDLLQRVMEAESQREA